MYHTSDFDFELPTELIASHPLHDRDASRMLVVDGQELSDKHIRDFISFLKPGDVVVFNNSDAVPCDQHWLEALVRPLLSGRAVFAFANQLPRPDATMLVRKDSERAFGDGTVSIVNGLSEFQLLERLGKILALPDTDTRLVARGSIFRDLTYESIGKEFRGLIDYDIIILL